MRTDDISFNPAAMRSSDPSPSFEDVELMGLRLHNVHRDEIRRRVVTATRAKRRMLVVNANAHLVVLSQRLEWLRELFLQANIAFCDGAGVQLAARILTRTSLHRTTPPEWIGDVLKTLGNDASIFWIGGRSEIVAQAAMLYQTQYGVRTAGIQDGFFDASPNSAATLALVERIHEAAPSILLVNMGMPRQERWIMENWDRLPPCVAITAGALVDHAAGRVQRPPRWVSDFGLEWLVRLLREPRRLWRRYLIGLPVFGFYIARYALVGQPSKINSGRSYTK